MAVINAVSTEDCRLYWPQFFGGLLGDPDTSTVVGVSWNPVISHFKVGEGGWIDPGTGKIPRTPDPALRLESAPLTQDLDAIVDPTRAPANQRYPSNSRATFQKALTLSNFSLVGTSTLEITCLLDFSDFNDDGFGNDPEIWEIGVFCDHPTEAGEKLMIAYGTFPQQTKTNGIQLSNIVQITL